MPHYFSCLSGLVLALLLVAPAVSVAPAGEEVDFNRDIRPILSENCFRCHGPDSATREADLRLDREEAALEDRGGYAAIVPGDPDASEFLRRIMSTDAGEQMPPPDSDKKLEPAQIELLTRWIKQGAKWSPAWSYVAPKRHDVPVVTSNDHIRNWIDNFVLARLEKETVTPAEQADPVTLVRRLHFDLVGLPPKPEVVDAFVADPSDAAYEKLVDELLASHHFGERMAMMWLDLVRFADTVGYHGDQTHNIWPYRDYVIHAFNVNLPFDQFTREQLAGDLLPNCTEDQLIASGYNRLLQTSHEGGVQVKEYRAIYLADRVRNVSQVWMGATVGCAQCHDHKYDPYTARDFYSLGAFFADIEDEQHLVDDRGLNALPSPRYPEKQVLSVYQREKLAELDRQIDLVAQGENEQRLVSLRDQRDKLAGQKSPTMISHSIAPREVRVQARGDWQDESGEIVAPAVPAFLGKARPDDARATRLDLANWFTHSTQGIGGLTARVMVNRYWALMFGEGLARVLDDFGGQGEPPSHPELLDNLAVEYIGSGWNTKHILKTIVMSSTYRQSSQANAAALECDPLNGLLARQNRFRLPAESVRDSLLSVSGLIDLTVGGPSVRPYQPPKHYQYLNFPKREYEQSTGSDQWRRGVYMHWQRTFLHPMLKAFDASTREECTAKRPRSNTALSALVLLNDPNSVEAARVFAAKILTEHPTVSDSERIDLAFREAVSRLPNDRERQVIAELLKSSREVFSKTPDAAKSFIAIGMSPAGADMPRKELAAWTSASRAILNMSETTTRN
jgi:mono/diheme cytochrome c family protein